MCKESEKKSYIGPAEENAEREYPLPILALPPNSVIAETSLEPELGLEDLVDPLSTGYLKSPVPAPSRLVPLSGTTLHSCLSL